MTASKPHPTPPVEALRAHLYDLYHYTGQIIGSLGRSEIYESALKDLTYLEEQLETLQKQADLNRRRADTNHRLREEIEAERDGLLEQLEAVDEDEPNSASTPRVTHGRHCRCTPCSQEDWTQPHLVPCGMHGPSCPPVYAPYPAVYEPNPASGNHPRVVVAFDEGTVVPASEAPPFQSEHVRASLTDEPNPASGERVATGAPSRTSGTGANQSSETSSSEP